MACPSSNATACCWRRICLPAHQILRRPSQDLDFATRMTRRCRRSQTCRNAFQAAGYQAELVEATGRHARLTLRLPGSGEELEMDLLKEGARSALRHRPGNCQDERAGAIA